LSNAVQLLYRSSVVVELVTSPTPAAIVAWHFPIQEHHLYVFALPVEPLMNLDTQSKGVVGRCQKKFRGFQHSGFARHLSLDIKSALLSQNKSIIPAYHRSALCCIDLVGHLVDKKRRRPTRSISFAGSRVHARVYLYCSPESNTNRELSTAVGATNAWNGDDVATGSKQAA
jgi:hypothetical protein